MALTPLQLQELQDISIVLADEFPSNVDDIWNTAIRFQLADIGPLGPGGLPTFEAAVADLKIVQEQLQTVQGRNAGDSTGYLEGTLVEAPPGGAPFPMGVVGDVLYIDVAPNTYLATSVLSLTPAGPNSVILSEVAAQVARTVAPAAGGIEVNNLLTGAGFERVLTTADLGGGAVASVNSGTNITVDNTDPANPIINLDAAILGVSVNGVTLSDAGAATSYLDETGAYSVPPAGAIPDPLILGSINLTSALLVSSTGTPYDNVAINIGANLIGTQGMTQLARQNIQTKPSAFGFNSTLFININGAGTNGSDTFIGGLNSASIEVAFGVAVRMQHGTASAVVAETAAPAAGGFLVNNTLTGGGLERVLTLGDLAGQVDSVVGGTNISVNAADPVNPIVNLDAAITGVSVNGVTLNDGGAATSYLDETGAYSVPPAGAIPDPLIIGSINATSSGSVADTGTPYTNVALNIGANLIGTQGMTQFGRQNIQERPSAFGFNSTLFININGTGSNGANTFIGGLNSASIEVEFGIAVRFQHGLVSAVVAETAAPAAGGFLVNNTLTGGGLERVLTVGDLGVGNPLTADLDGNGFNLIDMGVLKQREQAAADADVAGAGQLWVRTETFSNSLMWTNDNGNDFLVAGLSAGSDISAGSNLITGTAFVAVANVSPRINTEYFVMASVEVVAPAADDINIQFTIDTNARFYGTLSNTEDSSVQIIEGQTAEVITNNVLVPTSGTATPGGTYVTIIGRLIMGATTGTMSLRIAKNADTGADGFAIRGAITLIPIDPQ